MRASRDVRGEGGLVHARDSNIGRASGAAKERQQEVQGAPAVHGVLAVKRADSPSAVTRCPEYGTPDENRAARNGWSRFSRPRNRSPSSRSRADMAPRSKRPDPM